MNRHAPRGPASQLRQLAHSHPAAAAALILSALNASGGHRINAAVSLQGAELLRRGGNPYKALLRCVAALPGLAATIEARWPSVAPSELGTVAELAAKLGRAGAALRGKGYGFRADAIEAHVAKLATPEGLRMARQAIRRIEFRGEEKT